MDFFFLMSWTAQNRCSLLRVSPSHCSGCPWLSDTFFNMQVVLLLRDQSFASSPRLPFSSSELSSDEATNSFSSFLLTASAFL